MAPVGEFKTCKQAKLEQQQQLSVSVCGTLVCLCVCVPCGMWHVLYTLRTAAASAARVEHRQRVVWSTRTQSGCLARPLQHTHKYIDTHRHIHLHTHIHPHTLGLPHAHVSWHCACGRVFSSGPAAASIINGLRSTKVWQLLCCQWRNVFTTPTPSCIFFPRDLP